jgi:hypothetical protein
MHRVVYSKGREVTLCYTCIAYLSQYLQIKQHRALMLTYTALSGCVVDVVSSGGAKEQHQAQGLLGLHQGGMLRC